MSNEQLITVITYLNEHNISLVDTTRLNALERLWKLEQTRSHEWYPEPRNEYEATLDILASLDMKRN